MRTKSLLARDFNTILGVLGIQFKDDDTLIRHAYVRTRVRQKNHMLSVWVCSRQTNRDVCSAGR